MAESRASQLFFDPDQHPDDTLKAFDEFVEDFELRYDANYPDPPKVSLETAVQRWKLVNEDKKPSIDDLDEIIEQWRSRDRVAKFLGIYSSRRMHSDWKVAQPSEKARKNPEWSLFLSKMREYYKPTENLTLKFFKFRSLVQSKTETFIAFCIRVEKEAKHCQFKCEHEDCSAEMIAVRDQVVIGITSDEIREEALKKSWDLDTLRREGMHMESAAKGAAEISGEAMNKLGKYSFRNMKDKNMKQTKKVNCFFCGQLFDKQNITSHAKKCPARSNKCDNCGAIGHYAKVCRNTKVV